MPSALGYPEVNVQVLKGLIGWLNESSFELIRGYRRPEKRAHYLRGQLGAKHQEIEASLRQREEARAYLLSVSECLKAGVLISDHNLHPTFVNRRLIALAGAVDEERAVQLLEAKLATALCQGR